MKRKIILSLCTVVIALAAMTRFGMTQEQPPPGVIEELALFAKTLAAIRQGYVDDTEPRQLFYEAVKGIAKSLDPYSEFISVKKRELLEMDIKGEYGGIGAELIKLDDTPAVGVLYPTGAGALAGLEENDKILKVDGEDVATWDLGEVASKIRGEVDTEVTLTILRDRTEETLEIVAVRATIEILAVRDVEMKGKSLGYMKVINFQENTAEQFNNAMDELAEEGMQAVIIDLRNNSGGVLPGGIAMAERFLESGKTIVNVKSKVDVQEKEHVSEATHASTDLKVVILVNRVSASASEVFSAAMQDHNRAIIVGNQSYGKASVQSVVPLDDVTALKLTTARYLTPKGRQIDGKGITPDYVVEDEVNQALNKDAQLEKAVDLLKEFL